MGRLEVHSNLMQSLERFVVGVSCRLMILSIMKFSRREGIFISSHAKPLRQDSSMSVLDDLRL